MPEFLPGDEILRGIITPEGKVVDEVLIFNPYTGEIYPLRTITDISYNAETGRPESTKQKVVPVGMDGSPLTNIENIVFCGVCFQPVAKTQSVIDPFCGRTLCLMHSQMVEVNGMTLRICSDCAKALKKARRWQTIKNLLLGR